MMNQGIAKTNKKLVLDRATVRVLGGQVDIGPDDDEAGVHNSNQSQNDPDVRLGGWRPR